MLDDVVGGRSTSGEEEDKEGEEEKEREGQKGECLKEVGTVSVTVCYHALEP